MILLERATEVVSGGMPVQTWSSLATVRGKATFETGKEMFQSQQTFSARRALLLIRWRPDVRVTDRATLDGQRWNIESVREVGRRVALELMVTATE